jgi:hypothetical protein
MAGQSYFWKLDSWAANKNNTVSFETRIFIAALLLGEGYVVNNNNNNNMLFDCIFGLLLTNNPIIHIKSNTLYNKLT